MHADSEATRQEARAVGVPPGRPALDFLAGVTSLGAQDSEKEAVLVGAGVWRGGKKRRETPEKALADSFKLAGRKRVTSGRKRLSPTHFDAVAGVQEEVGGVGVHGGLVGDRSVAQGHPHDGRHVGFGSEHVDGNTRGLS